MSDNALFTFMFSSFRDLREIHGTLDARLRLRFWLVLALQTATALLESSAIIVISFFALGMSSPEALREHFVVRTILPHLPDAVFQGLANDRVFVTAMCLVVVAFIALKNATAFAAGWAGSRFAERVGCYISDEVLARYFARDYRWHISRSGADTIERLNFRGQLAAMTTAILQMTGNLLCAAVVFASLFAIEPGLTLIVLAVFAVICAATFTLLRRRVDATGRELADLASRENAAYLLAQRGMREIILYGKRDAFREGITGAMRRQIRHKSFLAVAGAVPAWLLEIAGFATVFGVMIVQVARGLPMPQVVAAVSMLFLAAWRILPCVSRVMGNIVHIRGLRPMALSCLTLLQDNLSDGRRAAARPVPGFRFERSLELRDAGFAYPDADGACLRGLSLAIAKGESVGVIGVSGAGKTTLALILAGLFEPGAGAFLVDGLALTPERREAYRALVGLVPQNPLLMPGSVAENVALGRWGEALDRDKLRRVCELAAMDFVLGDERGVDRLVGGEGGGLSGGQAQRVAIARALYTDPEILIFDEATSSLDLAGENGIRQTIRRVKGRVTTVIVAHRLSTVADCDRVVWLDAGGIVRQGSPDIVIPDYASRMVV